MTDHLRGSPAFEQAARVRLHLEPTRAQILPFSRDPNPTRVYRIEDGVIRPLRPAPRPTCLRRGDAARFAAYLEGRGIPPAPFAAELHPEPEAPDLWPARAIWFCAGILFPFIMGILR